MYARIGRALGEIARCLKPEGLAMIDTHRGGRRDPHRGRVPPGSTPTSAEDWFAANGDAWIYGEDFLDRVRGAGLDPVEIELFPDAPARFFAANGLKPHTRALFASRDPAGLRRFFGDVCGICTPARPDADPPVIPVQRRSPVGRS